VLADKYNWDVMHDPEIQEIVERHAATFADAYGGTYLDREDLTQEAWIQAAKDGDRLLEKAAAGDYGFIDHEIERNLIDLTKTQRRRGETFTQFSLDSLLESAGDRL